MLALFLIVATFLVFAMLGPEREEEPYYDDDRSGPWEAYEGE